MQDVICEAERLGAMPSEDSDDIALVKRWEAILDEIRTPVTNEEALLLSGLFGPDSCYGLGWALLSIVETAPGWPVSGAVERMTPAWSETATQRIENARRLGRLPKAE